MVHRPSEITLTRVWLEWRVKGPHGRESEGAQGSQIIYTFRNGLKRSVHVVISSLDGTLATPQVGRKENDVVSLKPAEAAEEAAKAHRASAGQRYL